MATITEKLTQLEQDRDDLVDNLTTMGIEDLTGDETFTELVPKVLDISGGGGDVSEYFYESPTAFSFQSKIGNIIKKVPRFTIPNNITNLSNLFNGCKLTSVDLSGIDFSRVTNVQYIFGNSKIENYVGVESFLTNNITDMSYMFSNANVSNFDFSKLDTSHCTNMTYMFSYINGATSLDLTNFDTSKVTNMSYMFENNNSLSTLTSIDISTWNMEKVNNISGMFSGSMKLENLSFGINFGKGFTMNGMSFSLEYTSLNHDSLMSVINNLYDLTLNNKTANLVLGTTNLAKLTSAEIQIATDKGWTVS